MFNCCTTHVLVSTYGAPMYTSGLQAVTVFTKQSPDAVKQCVILSQ